MSKKRSAVADLKNVMVCTSCSSSNFSEVEVEEKKKVEVEEKKKG